MDTENSKTTKKTISRIWSIFTKTVLIGFIVILLIILIRAFVFNKTDIFGYRAYLIMSGSMEPEIKVKDAVITKEVKDYKQGDIIAFKNGNSTTVHRIVKEYKQGNNKLYQTKGDNNNVEDTELVQQDQIKGKVVNNIKGAGNIVMFLKQNFIFVILAAGIIIIVLLVRRLI